MHINSIIHDMRRANSVNQSYAVSPVIDAPRTLDRDAYLAVTTLPTKQSGTLIKRTVTITYPKLRDYDKPRTRTLEAYTNATHKRNARHKRTPIIS